MLFMDQADIQFNLCILIQRKDGLPTLDFRHKQHQLLNILLSLVGVAGVPQAATQRVGAGVVVCELPLHLVLQPEQVTPLPSEAAELEEHLAALEAKAGHQPFLQSMRLEAVVEGVQRTLVTMVDRGVAAAQQQRLAEQATKGVIHLVKEHLAALEAQLTMGLAQVVVVAGQVV